MRLPKTLATLLRASIKDSTIGKNNTSRHHHAVTVGMHATVHTRCVVDNDATHHCRTNRGRVRWEYTPIRLQNLVHLTAYNTWLQTNGFYILAQLVLFPMLACNNQDGI